MADKDYYQLLGVDRKATKEEIKKAYKKLAMKFHPDRAPEDKKKEYEEKFKEISVAASVLGDDKKRSQYDQFGNAAFSDAGGGSASGFEGYDFSDIMSQFRSGSFGNFDDVFDQLFGGNGQSRRGSRSARGSDLLQEIEITLEDVAKGKKELLQLNKLEHCPACQGRGATKFDSCQHCHGSGYLKRTQRTAFGLFQQTGPCPYCQGRGELPQDSCSSCGGEGVLRKKKKLEVQIPPGVEAGMRLRLAQEGEVGSGGGPAGDLYIHILVKEHPVFTRRGDDIEITVPISFTQAVLGDDIEVPTISGQAQLKIPAGTSSETIFRMRGQGLPSLHDSGKGDQMVKVRIEVPSKLTKKQIELIKELHEENPSKNFFARWFG
ncbi:TPA: molecular chaperone DnaJ [Candidatus Woesearchaeota archaeon]|nr:molecular chaperone DnaJ [Candidatus Woesearchaeota archaeon]